MNLLLLEEKVVRSVEEEEWQTCSVLLRLPTLVQILLTVRFSPFLLLLTLASRRANSLRFVNYSSDLLGLFGAPEPTSTTNASSSPVMDFGGSSNGFGAPSKSPAPVQQQQSGNGLDDLLF